MLALDLFFSFPPHPYKSSEGKKGCEKEEREEEEVVLRTHKFGGTRETKELTRDRLT